MSSDQRNPARQVAERLAAENRSLRGRLADLEAQVARLQQENASLTAAQAAALLEPIEEMQPV
ncbi:hypothetical protein IE331_05240 [Nocardioides sp. MJB4]|uniref:Uncharacterized protein n=2 Tax=Nocardioides donggukensis TaxID=2774019 RepID=A0A927K7B8_9ACTN|nr:hypothetical protein [Nocardioides donggukensis]